MVQESTLPTTLARDLIAQLLPGVDADRVVRALLAERDAPGTEAAAGDTRYDSESEIAERELARVRDQFALGASARSLQHAFNNPLTALLAEAQLLELDAMPEEHRLAVSRILELSRRLVTLSRRLGVQAGDPPVR
jgi:signal transduction histidine kinase